VDYNFTIFFFDFSIEENKILLYLYKVGSLSSQSHEGGRGLEREGGGI